MGKKVIYVTEIYHNWGCGALNDTGICSCGEGWTAEAMARDSQTREIAMEKQSRVNKKMGVGLSMSASLERIDKIAMEVKSHII